MSSATRRRRARTASVAIAAALVVAAACSSSNSPSSSSTASQSSSTSAYTAPTAPPPFAIPATRTALTNDSTSPVVHDNEVMALAPHDGRLFAATDQWEYGGPNAAGQVLVKDSASSPWRVFEPTQSLRVQVLDSFPIPSDQGLGPGHSLLVTQAIIDGHSEIQWLLDGAASFAADDSFRLVSNGADVRAFGAHEDRGVWSVYAGVAPTGVLRGTWSKARHTLVFDPAPELSAASPQFAGQKSQKVTGFADCGDALYVSINTHLYRRNDGTFPVSTPRWALAYSAPPVGAFNSGIRGVTCIEWAGAPALLLSTEGNGDVLRLDHLPAGVRAAKAPPLAPTLEFAPIPAIRSMLAAHGTTVPVTGRGSISYVIAAYNDFTPASTAVGPADLFGFEWGYTLACPPTRTCGPISRKVEHFDAAACFALRTVAGDTPHYTLHCLSGPTVTPTGTAGPPVRSGQAFTSIRTIGLSPFGDGQFYLGGYDCNFYPADGTAWIASASLDALGVGSVTNATNEEGS